MRRFCPLLHDATSQMILSFPLGRLLLARGGAAR